VNNVPPNDEPPDDIDGMEGIDDLYRRAAALDPSRPSEQVRRAVLSHAAQLAAEHRTAAASNAVRPNPDARAFVPRRRLAIFGTLAAAVLAGLIVVPRFLLTRDETPPANVMPIASVEPIAPTAAATLPRASSVAPDRVAPRDRATASVSPPTSAEAPKVAAVPGAARKSAHAELASGDVIGGVSDTGPAFVDQPSSAVFQAGRTLHPAPNSPVSQAVLRRAAERGEIPKLQAMLELGVDVNARDADDRSALLLGVLNGRSDVVELLLAHGANVNAADRNGTTPLQAAVSTHQTAIAATLRAAGAH